METNEKVDWLSITYPSNTKLMNILPDYIHYTIERTKSPIPVYSTALLIKPLGIVALRGHERLGLHLIFSGKTMARLREHEITPHEIYNTMRKYDGKISRIDLALDVMDEERFTPEACYKRFLNKSIETELQGSKFIGANDTLETLYLGSMKSRKRKLRIYDKQVEMQTDYSWVRVEYEKRRGAMTTARNIFVDGTKIREIIKSVVDFPKWVLWQEIIDCEPATITRDKSQVQDWKDKLVWILQTCSPAIANAVVMEMRDKQEHDIDKSEVLNTFALSLASELRSRLADRVGGIDNSDELLTSFDNWKETE